MAASTNWETRHGTALALREVIKLQAAQPGTYCKSPSFTYTVAYIVADHATADENALKSPQSNAEAKVRQGPARRMVGAMQLTESQRKRDVSNPP